MMKNKIFLFYLIVGLGDLLAIALDSDTLEWIFKPLIMPVLAVFYFSNVDRNSEDFSRQVLLAMILSWLGDIALMLLGLNEIFFIVGLGSFLIAHLLYILAYRQHRIQSEGTGLVGIQKFRYAFPIVLAGTGLITILYPHLGDLRIPVLIYAIVLVVMVLEALFRFGQTTISSFWSVFVGALFFLVSDSLIAIQKFLGAPDFFHFLVMGTYLLAQFLIIRGLVLHTSSK